MKRLILAALLLAAPAWAGNNPTPYIAHGVGTPVGIHVCPDGYEGCFWIQTDTTPDTVWFTATVGTAGWVAASAVYPSLINTGADPGATCVAGQVFLDTDEGTDTNCTTTADNSLCLCTATNTWTALENN